MVETTWSEQRVRELLAREDFAYQDIALPYGLSTGGANRSRTAEAVLPRDLRGRSVLDVGSKYGYFCFEAARRGAQRVVGADVDPDSIRKARLLADCLGRDVQFEAVDVEAVDVGASDVEAGFPREAFDVVLCLNLLHHMRNPLAVLDRLALRTRERLVLEVAALGGHDRRKLGLSRLASRRLQREPILYVSRNGSAGKRSVQKFFLTRGAIENLLLHHRHSFARVDFLPSEHKDRFLAVAHRRRIERLVVVAGPTSAGKSTLIGRLQRNELPEIATRLGLGDGAAWPHAGSQQLGALTEPQLPRLLFHYDFLRPYLRSAKVHARDEGLDVLACAAGVTTLTLWCSPARLRAQLQRGEIARKSLFGVHWGPGRHRRLAREYTDPARVREHYRRWFEYLRGRPGEHWVVDVGDGVRMLPVAAWETLAGGAV